MEKIEDIIMKILKNKLGWIEYQVWEPKDWEESNLDECNIKFDNQKIVKT